MAFGSEDPTAERARQTRARPTLSALLPAGWFFKESLTLLAPEGDANVIASSEPIPDDLDARAYAEMQGDLLEQKFDGYHEHAFEQAVLFGGKDAYVRRFEWSPEGTEPVMQIQLYYAEGGRGYTATATTPRKRFEDVELRLTEVLQGLVIEPDVEEHRGQLVSESLERLRGDVLSKPESSTAFGAPASAARTTET